MPQLVDHLHCANNLAFSKNALSILLEKNKPGLMPTITYLMEKIPTLSFNQKSKIIGDCEIYCGRVIGDSYTLSFDNWTPLISGMLNHGHQQIAQLIIKYAPQCVTQTVTALRNFLLKLYDLDMMDCDTLYELSNFTEFYITLLLQIKTNTPYQACKKESLTLSDVAVSALG